MANFQVENIEVPSFDEHLATDVPPMPTRKPKKSTDEPKPEENKKRKWNTDGEQIRQFSVKATENERKFLRYMALINGCEKQSIQAYTKLLIERDMQAHPEVLKSLGIEID